MDILGDFTIPLAEVVASFGCYVKFHVKKYSPPPPPIRSVADVLITQLPRVSWRLLDSPTVNWSWVSIETLRQDRCERFDTSTYQFLQALLQRASLLFWHIEVWKARLWHLPASSTLRVRVFQTRTSSRSSTRWRGALQRPSPQTQILFSILNWLL